MSVNKIVYGGDILIDLTQDTVTPETLMKDVTAHDKSGRVIVGESTYAEELREMTQSVNEGKQLIAAAITDKGVETDAGASFEEMAGNIGSIQSVKNVVNEVFVFDLYCISSGTYAPEITNRIYARQPYLGAKLEKIRLTSKVWPLSPNSNVGDPLRIGPYSGSTTLYCYIDLEYFSKGEGKSKTITIFSFSSSKSGTSIDIEGMVYTLSSSIIGDMNHSWLYTNIRIRFNRYYNIKVNTVLGIEFVYS